MSGFLSHLLARSRGTAEVIRPRVASRFEPQGIAAGDWGDVSEEFEEPHTLAEPGTKPDAANEGESRAEVRRPTALRADSLSEQELEQPADVIAQSEHRTPSQFRSIKEFVVTAPEPVLPQQRLSGSPATDAPQVVRSTRLTTPATAPKMAAAERLSPLDSRRKAAVDARLREDPQAIDWPAELHETIPIRQTAAGGTQPSIPAVRRRPRFEPQVPVQKAAVSEPSIHVTIGRIEVRAVSEPAARGKERADSPVMSLGDYLKTHRAGAKR